MLADEIPRVDVLGVGIHSLNMQAAVRALDEAACVRRRGYVTVTDVHGIVRAQDDPAFLGIINESLLTTPDGMPTVWIGRSAGYQDMARVYGPELMLAVCEHSVRTGHTHFLYGGHPGIAEKLAAALRRRFPGIRIAGTFTPPFRALNAEEESALIQMVNALRPDYFWVGLGTPKQERFMARYVDRMDAGIMLGVGAAFNVLSGELPDAPRWIKRSGLQWLHRLCQEPRRLWRRYLFTHPRFVYLWLTRHSHALSAGTQRE